MYLSRVAALLALLLSNAAMAVIWITMIGSAIRNTGIKIEAAMQKHAWV